MTIYQIIDWDKHFENSKSRTYDNCSFVCLPNKQDGDGFNRFMTEPDGWYLFGIWTAIVQLCSRQRRPRQGFLTSTGRRDGQPWDAAYLAFRFRSTDVQRIQKMLDFTVSPAVGWMQAHSSDTAVLESNSHRIPQYPERKKERRKEGKERQVPESDPTPPPQASPNAQESETAAREREYLAQFTSLCDELEIHDPQEWLDFVRKLTKIKTVTEALACVRWAVMAMRKDDKTVEYARHCKSKFAQWESVRDREYRSPTRDGKGAA